MPVAQNGRHARKQVLDGRIHLGHADHICNSALCCDHACQRLGKLFAQLLKEHHTQVRQQGVLAALLDDDGQLRRQVGRLLPRARILVVEAPQDRRHDLHQVRLDPHPERIGNGADAIQHDTVFNRLFLERIDHAIDKLNLQPLVYIGCAKRCDDMLDRVHRHLAEWLAIVLQKVYETADDVAHADLVCKSACRLDDFAEVPPVQCHAAHPECLEIVRHELRTQERARDAVRHSTLPHNFQHNAPHLVIGTLELADQRGSDLLHKVQRAVRVHQRNDEPNRLEECR